MKEEKDNISWEDAVKQNSAYRWEVRYSVAGGFALLFINRGMSTLRDSGVFVNTPNLFERMIGITYKSKIEKAICKQKEKCIQLNESDAKSGNLKTDIQKILTGYEVK